MAVGSPYPVFPSAAPKGQAIDITGSSGSPTLIHEAPLDSATPGHGFIDYLSVELVNRGATGVTVNLILGVGATGSADEWAVELQAHEGLQMVCDRKPLRDGAFLKAWGSSISVSAYAEVLREQQS